MLVCVSVHLFMCVSPVSVYIVCFLYKTLYTSGVSKSNSAGYVALNQLEILTRWPLSRHLKFPDISTTLRGNPPHVVVTHVMHTTSTTMKYNSNNSIITQCNAPQKYYAINMLLNTGVAPNMKLQRTVFPDWIFPWQFPDICQIILHFQVLQTSGHTLIKAVKN